MFLAGLAVELLLKAAVCRNIDEQRLPDQFKIHDLDSLLMLAGLRKQLQQDPGLVQRWAQLNTAWRSGGVRYSASNIEADVDAVFQALADGAEKGIWEWVPKRT